MFMVPCIADLYLQLSNEMQHKAVYYSASSLSVNHTHHQYTKLELQSLVLVIFFVQLPPSNVAKLGHVRGR